MKKAGDSFSTLSHKDLYVKTSVIKSTILSQKCGFNVYLKLENTQPAHSFKLRGISYRCLKAKQSGYHTAVCASGGNAGLACAHACKQLGIQSIIIVPQTTPQFARDRLTNEGATVEVYGTVWDESNEKAQQMAKEPGYTLIHPFDDADVWEGHATMMHEIQEQLPCKPDLIVASVGGGGLLCGIIQGLADLRWQSIPILAMETVGAHCFNAAIQAGQVVEIPAITSVAKCLGAKKVCGRLFECYENGEVPIISELVTDRLAVHACLHFADEHKMLVEPACGAALAAVENSDLVDRHVAARNIVTNVKPVTDVVVIVCGGAGVTLQELDKWRVAFNL